MTNTSMVPVYDMKLVDYLAQQKEEGKRELKHSQLFYIYLSIYTKTDFNAQTIL
jgi:hypothetical protein